MLKSARNTNSSAVEKKPDLKNPQVRSNSVVIPGFGTAFRIKSVSTSGHKAVVPIAISPNSRIFYALFEEDDVDFEIQIDNTACTDRDVEVQLDVHNKQKGVIVPNSWNYARRSFETNGRKFHFIRQSGEEGQCCVGLLAAERGLTFEDAACLISRIGFSVRYSTPGYRIYVKTLTGKTFEVVVHTVDTVEMLKHKIQKQHGLSPDAQRLIFGKRQLGSDETIADCQLLPDSIVHLVERLRGGGGGGAYALQQKNFGHDNIEVDRGERGAVVFGEFIESNRRDTTIYSGFSLDNSVQADNFTVELRLAPKWKV